MGWIVFLLGTIGWHIGIYGMFKKAGWETWKAWVPLLNTWTIVDKLKLKKYWFFAQLIPVLGQFVTIWIGIKFTEHFGRFDLLHHSAATFISPLYFPYLGFSKNERYAGKLVADNYKKPVSREWIDSAAFAVVAATFIRTFFFEAFTIPTSSMEKSLLVNDFLFVNKLAYGPRMPNTPLSIPFMHAQIVGTKTNSYLEWIKIPYTRYFAKPVQKGDPVVFNFPAGDTVTVEHESAIPYYQIRDDIANAMHADTNTNIKGADAIDKASIMLKTKTVSSNGFDLERDYGYPEFNVITRPVDKRENYIKRCVATAGDVYEVKNGDVYINGKLNELYPNAARFFVVYTNNYYNEDILRELGIRISVRETNRGVENDFINFSNEIKLQKDSAYKYVHLMNLTNNEADILRKIQGNKVEKYLYHPTDKPLSQAAYRIFPNTEIAKNWTQDFLGPIWIPKKGEKVVLNDSTVQLYKRAIVTYEKNTLTKTANGYLLNGKPATDYTFKMDYYWMMGDNRNKSQDSRFWGYVPEDHIVGRASFIWMSWENGPRWKRFFKSATSKE